MKTSIATVLFSFALAGCTDLEPAAREARPLELELVLDDREVAVAIDEAARPDEANVAMTLMTVEGVVNVVSDLDAAGRGTVVVHGDGVEHEIAISDTLLQVTSTREGETRLAYIARPRGDLLEILARFGDDLAPPDVALPAMPMHYLALRSLALAGDHEHIDERWATVARATWALADRLSNQPPTSAIYSDADGGDGDGDGDDAACQLTAVSGSAKINGGSGGALYMAGTLSCTDGTVDITAKGNPGSFTKSEKGITWTSADSMPLPSCTGHCDDPIGGAECYRAWIKGEGKATLTGVGVVGDGGDDVAVGPSCSMSSSHLSINLRGPRVTADAVAGSTAVNITAYVDYESDVFSNDFCEASGSGTSSASLTGGNGDVVCDGSTVGDPPTPSDPREH